MLLDFLGELVFEIIGEVAVGLLSPDLSSEGLAPMRHGLVAPTENGDRTDEPQGDRTDTR
jgi:hypothetical protein